MFLCLLNVINIIKCSMVEYENLLLIATGTLAEKEEEKTIFFRFQTHITSLCRL